MGNTILTMMGIQMDLDSDSDSSEDKELNEYKEKESYSCPLRLSGLDTDALDLDANYYQLEYSFKAITLTNIMDIENILDEYEKISLIFLLSDNIEDCLSKTSLYIWAKRESILDIHWQGKLVESLATIKDFEILKNYGFTKEWLYHEFYPHRYYTVKYINKFRKVLYYICEELDQKFEEMFLKEVKEDFKIKRLPYKDFPYLEMYFCYFLKMNYISMTNVKNCIVLFKKMGLDYIFGILEEFDKKEPTSEERIEFIVDKPLIQEFVSQDDALGTSEGFTSLGHLSNSTQDNAYSRKVAIKTIHQDNDTLNHVYDTTKAKKCLIIDEENFYTEFQSEYKELLPECVVREKLRRREGTIKDSQRLSAVLERRHFDVLVKKNRNHLEIIKDLETFIENIDKEKCSCVFVAILSHGDKGVVYGCNSCLVEVSTIIDIICNKKLKKMPKVLLLQSCQGPRLQTLKKEVCNLETDYPTKASGIRDPNLLIFSSTVPGFSSVRDKQEGSWFIQSVCNQLDQAGDNEHFQDICTRIIQEVTKKQWQQDRNTVCFMVPYLHSTLTKKLFLNL